jgi:hypothetical protein
MAKQFVAIVRHGADTVDDRTVPCSHVAEVRAACLVAEEAGRWNLQPLRDAVQRLHRRRNQPLLA